MTLREDLGLPDPEESEQLQQLREHLVRAPDLAAMSFPALVEWVEGLIVAGVTIIGGKPKLGKSWLVVRAGLAIATGGVAFGNPMRAVVQGKVLLLTLEDSLARLKQRLEMLLLPGEAWPESLVMATSFPKLDSQGVELLSELIEREAFDVVIIDTYARVRLSRSSQPSYQADTDALTVVHDLTRTRPGLAIVLVHHNRKDDAPEDYVDALSGTTGIAGVVDHIAVLQRSRGEPDAVLRYTSRDVKEHDTAFKLDDGMWTELGDALVYEQSQARQALLYTIDELGTARLTDLAEYLGKKKSTISQQLRALEREGLVHQEGKGGPWTRTPNSPNRPNPNGDELGELGGLGQLGDEEE